MTRDDHLDNDDPARDEAVEALMRQSARWLLADADPQAYVERLVQHGPRLFGALFNEVRGLPAADAAQQQAQFFRAFGWAIASAMPLPQLGYVAHKLPLPGRNETCMCGSGRKFKHCCARVYEGVPTFDATLLAVFMLLEMPRKAWAALPGSRVPLDAVLQATLALRDEGEARAALALLDPWARQPAPWPAAWAPLLDLLCDIYLDEGHPLKRRKLAQAMVDKGEVSVQSAGWRRLSMMAADAGDTDGARLAFENAQRLTPDEPDVALLEVTTLLSAGQRERAAERAAFHARRLARLPHAAALGRDIGVLQAFGRGEFPPLPDLDEALDDEVGGAGACGLTSVLSPDAPFQRLQRWADGLPPPKLRLRVDGAPLPEQGLVLAPAAALIAPLARWRKAFGLQPPASAWGQLGPEALEVFVNERWSALLARETRLADCFEVLDGLVLALDLVPPGLVTELQALLLMRALELWRAVLARWPATRCEWLHLDNRPALRLLVRCIELDSTPRAEDSLPWLQAMVDVLNPHDNHGLRERLAAVHLRRGDAAAALALCERYPGDFVGMQLLHTLALLALQRLPQAAAMWKSALAANAHVPPLLTARRAPRPPDVPSFAVGSMEQARVAVAAQHDLWRAAPVQAWLKAQLQAAVAPGLFD